MDKAILGTLANWGETTGWDLWSDGEGVAQQRQLLVDPNGNGYKQFKTALARLEGSGLIERASVKRQVAKATWRATTAGRELLEREGEDGPSLSAQELVGKRIKCSAPVTREVWRTLMARHRAGELDIAFLPAKTTGGSGR